MISGNVAKTLAFNNWLNWLNKRFPGSKARIVKNAANRMGNRLGQESGASEEWYEQVISAATAIIPTYYNYKMQSKLVDAQIARARAGQAPLDTAYFAPTATLAPTVRHEISAGMTDQTKNLLLYGGLGLAAFYLFK